MGGYTTLLEPIRRPRAWRRWGREVLDWWLVRARGHSLLAHLGPALVVWAVLWVTLHRLHATDSWMAGAGTEAVIVGVSLVLPALLTFVALGKQVRLMFALLDVPARSVPMMRRVVTKELSTLNERIADLLADGRSVHSDSIPDWLRRTCFSGAYGAYVAVDIFRPSEFMQRYEELLDVHRTYVEGGAPRSARINVSGRAALEQDASEHADLYRKYVNWHAENGVLLLHCEPADAAEAARAHGLGDAPADVGLWNGELALLGIPSSDGTACVKLGLVDEPRYHKVDGYVRALLAIARPLTAWP